MSCRGCPSWAEEEFGDMFGWCSFYHRKTDASYPCDRFERDDWYQNHDGPPPRKHKCLKCDHEFEE